MTGAVIDPGVWDRVQVVRSAFKRRHPGYPAKHRIYALSGLLFCAACGRRLTGHGGHYRHVDPCDAFIAAGPGPTGFPMIHYHGHSYPADAYDRLIPDILAHVAKNATLKASVIGLNREMDGGVIDSSPSPASTKTGRRPGAATRRTATRGRSTKP